MPLALALLFLLGADPVYEPLTKGFDALRARDYDSAIVSFRQAVELSPSRADIRKNLAYTLLKTGESEAAREQFGIAMRIDPADFHVALEYAFLSFESPADAPARKAEARRIFARVRDTASDATLRVTALQAFRNIDEPLQASSLRWRQVVSTSSPTFSAFYELAQLAEQGDDLESAAAGYRTAFTLLPDRKSVLLELARVERARGNSHGVMAALLAASRGGEPRAAELAREQLPDRYPYVYEFRKALELDPKNDALHRELAYLLLSMSQNHQASQEDAQAEFRALTAQSPGDYLAAAQLGLLYLAEHRDDLANPILKNVLGNADAATANRVRMALHMPLVLENRASSDAPALDPRVLGERSYNAGFLKDALRYYLIARELNPVDSSVALKLAWTNNLLHDDATALHWFNIARRSADPAVATEAEGAWKNLRPSLERARTTVWMYPLFSSRWNDVFGYGQVKTEFRVAKLPFRPYVSMRVIGDARRSTGGVAPQSLSESALIFGAGIATRPWRGGMAWFEAGEAVSYLSGLRWHDYRGGVSYSRTRGASLASDGGGWFLETLGDSVFVSHFGNDLINYSQNKAGRTGILGGLKTQSFWAANLIFDARRMYWANYVETGPGFRFHVPRTPDSVSLTITAMRGVYLINQGNPRRPDFNDVRAGLWYAFTK